MSEYTNIKLDAIHGEITQAGKVMKCQATIDGKGPIELAFFPEKQAEVKVGATLRAKYNPPKGDFPESWFTVGAAKFTGGGGKGGGGGGWKPDPARDASIVKQTCFKGGIELICAGKLELNQLKAFITHYATFINGTTVADLPPAKPANEPKDDVPF